MTLFHISVPFCIIMYQSTSHVCGWHYCCHSYIMDKVCLWCIAKETFRLVMVKFVHLSQWKKLLMCSKYTCTTTSIIIRTAASTIQCLCNESRAVSALLMHVCVFSCRSCASVVRLMGTAPAVKSACCVWGIFGRSAATVWVSAGDSVFISNAF